MLEPSLRKQQARSERHHLVRAPGGRLQLNLQARPPHGSLCRIAGRGASQIDQLERRQRTAVERDGKGGAAGVGDLGVAEAEPLELRQHTSRRRWRTCRQRRRHEGGEALVTAWVAVKIEHFQRGQPPQGRREGHQRRVGDGAVGQKEGLEPR
eukprot:scaffold84286_cov63-Phaeocystis_antarctica.AAC.8